MNFALPARSMKVMIFEEFSQISSGERQFPKFCIFLLVREALKFINRLK